MLIFEALQARYGDCLILRWGDAGDKIAVIDGGPDGVYPILKHRLDELAAGEQLPIEMMMISHIDEDHIKGILSLMQMLRNEKSNHRPLPYKIKRFWFNSFEELAGARGHTAEAASLANLAANEAAMQAWVDAMADDATKAVLASVGQGRGVRDIVNLLGLDGNRPINGMAVASNNKYDVGGLNIQVLGPLPDQIQALQEKWLAAPQGRTAALVAYIDKSTPNLSSIVCLVEHDGRKLLLTGDARGDYVLQGLKKCGLIDGDETLKLDLLKLPHHGSNRNIAPDFFEQLPADHYVISADGKDGNPDKDTIEMLIEAREDAEYTIHITNELPWMEDFFAEHEEGHSFTVDYRGKNDGDRIEIEL